MNFVHTEGMIINEILANKNLLSSQKVVVSVCLLENPIEILAELYTPSLDCFR